MSARKSCRECGWKHPHSDLRVATAAMAVRSYRIAEGDRLCRWCADDLAGVPSAGAAWSALAPVLNVVCA